jgi:hypothetical protein
MEYYTLRKKDYLRHYRLHSITFEVAGKFPGRNPDRFFHKFWNIVGFHKTQMEIGILLWQNKSFSCPALLIEKGYVWTSVRSVVSATAKYNPTSFDDQE